MSAADQFRGTYADFQYAVILGGPFANTRYAWITQLYGWVNPDHSDGPYGYAFHAGLDLVPFDPANVNNPIALGTPLLAMGYGIVSDSGFTVGRGNYVEITYGSTYRITYFHMQYGSTVAIGTSVIPGQTVGFVGSTGNSSGPHLHLVVDCLIPGLAGPVDPWAFLVSLNEVGYVPPMPLPTGIPNVWFDGYQGQGPQWWQYDFGITIARNQNGRPGTVAGYVGFDRVSVDADGKEHYRLRIENW